MHHSLLALLLLLAACEVTAYFETPEEEVLSWEMQVCSQMHTNLEQANLRCMNACMAKRDCKAGYCKIKDGIKRCKCGLCPMWNFRYPYRRPTDDPNNGPMTNLNNMNDPSQNFMH